MALKVKSHVLLPISLSVCGSAHKILATSTPLLLREYSGTDTVISRAMISKMLRNF